MTVTLGLDHHLGEDVPEPNGSPRDIEANLPAGMVVNPTATGAKCDASELDSTLRSATMPRPLAS